MMENNEIQNAPMIYDDEIVALAETAEKRVQAIHKIKQMSLKATNENDWCDQGGKPYLEGFGCEKVAGMFGIGWRDIHEPLMHIEEDGHYTYTYTGTFVMGGREIEVIGTRSSRDEFFTKRYKYDEAAKQKTVYYRPASEIDKGDVKKSAYTNLLMNGITRILGIRNLTYDDLRAAGLDVSKIAKVNYGEKQEMSEESKGRREEIKRMLMEMVDNDETKFAAALQKVTSFIGKDGNEIKGKSKLEDISEKAIGPNYNKVKKAYEQWKAGHNDGHSNDTESNN